MEVMRVPPYPIVTTWNLPDANYGYIVYVEDLVDHSIEETVITSDANGIVLYQLPLTKVDFDREFLIRFYDAEHQHILYEDSLNVIRPYVNPANLGETASEIKEYKMYEVIARSIIDTYINDGFYNHKSIVQAQGTGTDYMPIWRMANRVLKVYENNILIYNGQDVTVPLYSFYDDTFNGNTDIGFNVATTAMPNYVVGDQVSISLPLHGISGTYIITEAIDAYNFRINLKYSSIDTTISYTNNQLGTALRVWPYAFSVTLDNSAIQKVATTEYNRISQTLPDLSLPISRGDIQFPYERPDGGAFRLGYDYLFVLDEGFRVIPPDVERATTILINDIKCGKLDYYQRYVSEYDTDQFTIKFDGAQINGTGNLMVDKMLDKYTRGILKIGVI
jgi:hypothetical protein